jgi:hypothetical protein
MPESIRTNPLFGLSRSVGLDFIFSRPWIVEYFHCAERRHFINHQRQSPGEAEGARKGDEASKRKILRQLEPARWETNKISKRRPKPKGMVVTKGGKMPTNLTHSIPFWRSSIP